MLSHGDRYRSRSPEGEQDDQEDGEVVEEGEGTADGRRRGNHDNGSSHGSRQRREAASAEEESGRRGLKAVAAVAAAAKAVEEELREQLEAKDHALR